VFLNDDAAGYFVWLTNWIISLRFYPISTFFFDFFFALWWLCENLLLGIHDILFRASFSFFAIDDFFPRFFKEKGPVSPRPVIFTDLPKKTWCQLPMIAATDKSDHRLMIPTRVQRCRMRDPRRLFLLCWILNVVRCKYEMGWYLLEFFFDWWYFARLGSLVDD